MINLLKKIKQFLLKKTRLFLVEYQYPKHIFSKNVICKDEKHLEESIAWLCKAQDVTGCGGVSSHYDIATKKWGDPYRETTGYIIETLINHYHTTQKTELLERAIKMGEWEILVQCEDGSFGEVRKDGTIGKKVFNTGQVIIGLISLYKETRQMKYLESAEKAGQWLLKNQENDGSWDNFTTRGAKTYHSRVAWPLLLIFSLTKKIEYRNAAEKNITWVLAQQQDNYWFRNTSLSEKDEPWTHLIAYTISGLIECYLLMEKPDERIFNAFYNSSNTILEIFKKNDYSFLPCSFDNNWRSNDKYSCLTGDSQLAIVWMQIYTMTKEKKFLEGAEKIIDLVKETQIVETSDLNIKGGIFGSFPIHGEYAPFMLINWAAKFFADSLILKSKIKI